MRARLGRAHWPLACEGRLDGGGVTEGFSACILSGDALRAFLLSLAHVRDAGGINVTAHLPVIAPRPVNGYEGHDAGRSPANGKRVGQPREVRGKVAHLPVVRSRVR